MTLNAVSKMNDAAVAAFTVFSKRKRYRENTPILRFHQELEQSLGKINQDELVSMFRELEKQGIGSLVISRKPYKSYFKWGYSLRDVARVAKGEIGLADAERVKAKKAFKVGKRPQVVKPEKPVKEAKEIMIIKDGIAQTVKISSEKEQLFNQFLGLLG